MRQAARRRIGALVRERLQALRPRSYRRIAAAMLVTNVGNGMQFVANVWLALELTDHAYGVPLVLLTTALPGVLFGPLIGVAIDRFPRRLLFVATDVAAALVLAVGLALVVTDSLQTWHLFVIVFLMGLGESTAVPTGTTLVREIVPVDRLLAANATTGVAVQFGNLTGAAIGGFLISVSSVATVLALNLLTFLVSAAFMLGVRSGRKVPERPAGGGWRGSFKHAAMGVEYLRAHPKMVPSYLMLLTLFATLYLLNTLLAPYAADVLEVGPAGLGYIDAMFAVGAIAGGLVLPLLTARLDRDRLAGLGVIGLGLTLVALGGANGLLVPMLLYAAAGICFQSFYIFRTKVQEQVPVDLQGRVMALLITGVGICRLIVYGMLAIAASTVTLRLNYAVGGAALALLGCVVTVRAFRRSAGAGWRPRQLAPRVEGSRP
jgi:MFS family permease